MGNKPFLRWAGGKCKLINVLKEHAPNTYNHYWEPFLGAGSLFFALLPKNATLSDLNEPLIRCYEHIKSNPIKVSKYLTQIMRTHSESKYYSIRDEYNAQDIYDCKKAAMFIYLNKTCFNGIYRVNQQNSFNVPFGKITHPAIPSENSLINISDCLRKANLHHLNYQAILNNTCENDFIYLDPPYPPISETSKFVEYTKEKFNLEDQLNVATFANELSERGCKVLISNADTKFIKDIYNDWQITATTVKRVITCKSQKYNVEELIIKNY